MLNYIWAFLIVVGVFVGLGRALSDATLTETKKIEIVNGAEVVTVKPLTWEERVDSVGKAGNKLTESLLNSVSISYNDPVTGKERDGAIGLALGLIGIMTLWLGLMKVAEASGLINIFARLISPLFRIIFPSVPKNHPAQGAILMNYAANMLGLDNAATPLGIKAMQQLQTLNGSKDTASNAQCMFLALNISSLTLIPAGVIALRVTQKSVNTMEFWIPMIIVTVVHTVMAFFLIKFAERFSKDTPPAVPADIDDDSINTANADDKERA